MTFENDPCKEPGFEYNERGLMTWECFYEHRIKPHANRLDAYDVQIMKSIHTRWSKERPYVDVTTVQSDVQLEMGGLSDERFRKKLLHLENLALLVRMVRLN